MSQLFASGGQSTGVSALVSALPINTQDWSPLFTFFFLIETIIFFVLQNYKIRKATVETNQDPLDLL